MSSPSQIFIQTMFNKKELMSTKRAEASRIMGLVNNLSLEDIKVVSQYKEFLEVNGFMPREEKFTEPNTENFTLGVFDKEPNTETVNYGNYTQGLFYFKPSSTFQGSMPGWVFKTSTEGTGYYLDIS